MRTLPCLHGERAIVRLVRERWTGLCQRMAMGLTLRRLWQRLRLGIRAKSRDGAPDDNHRQADKEYRSRGGMTRGELMNSKTQGNTVFQGMGWVAGIASLLLLIGAGLELFVQQTLGHSSVATVLLALFLAFWSYALGLGLLLFLSVRWLVRWWLVRVTRAAVSRDAPVTPRSRRLEKPELEGALSFRQGVAPVVPSRSPKESVDENEPNNLTRVA